MNTEISGQPQSRRAFTPAAYAPAPQAFVIEVEGVTAGLALVRRGGYIFAPSDDRFQALEGAEFRRIEQVSRAVRDHLRALDRAPEQRRLLPAWQRPGLRRAV